MTPIEQDIMTLADLIGQKEILIRDMRNTVKRLKESEDSIVVVEVRRNGHDNPLRQNERLRAAIDSQAEWIIDRVYDTAIQNLEKEIAPLLEKIQQDKE